MMLSCEEISRLVSDSMDRKLPLAQRFAVWIHLIMCKFCSRYRKQLADIREIARKSSDLRQSAIKLPPEIRDRIKRNLQNSLKDLH
ncbi:zf-HC2 domain-containing protein [Thermodesulfobacteriota bacterium]